ncbi:MAG: hypothetical protein Tsb0013_14400 [Phycisphaerales bacterium]
MQAFADNGFRAPLFNAFDHSRSITVCAVDLMGCVRYANDLFREHVQRYYEWPGGDHTFTVDHLAMGDTAHLRERVDILTRVLDAKGQPVRCLELSGGRAIEHTCVAMTLPDDPRTMVCVVASARAAFDAPGGCCPEECEWLMVPTDPGVLGDLTHAELETLRMIAKNCSTEDIADHLSRTKKAIERRRMSIRRKLGLDDRMALTRLSMETGLGHLPESRLSEFVRCCRTRQRHLRRLRWESPELAHA